MKLVVISVAKRKKVFPVRLLSWVLVAAYLTFMFVLSHQDGITSNSLSESIANALKPYMPAPAALGGSMYTTDFNGLIRELAHFLEFFILAILIHIALYSCRVREGRNAVLTLSICLLCAAIDEIHQSFVPGRSPVAIDLIIDAAGGIFGLIFVYLISIIKEKIMNGRQALGYVSRRSFRGFDRIPCHTRGRGNAK